MCVEQRAQLTLGALQLALLHLCQTLLHLPHCQHTLAPMAMPKSEPREPQRQRFTAGPGAQHARVRNRLQRINQDLQQARIARSRLAQLQVGRERAPVRCELRVVAAAPRLQHGLPGCAQRALPRHPPPPHFRHCRLSTTKSSRLHYKKSGCTVTLSFDRLQF